jgi:hypothetical protein
MPENDSSTAATDPVGFLGKYLRDQVGDVWGIEPLDNETGIPGTTYKFTKCKALRLSRDAGYEALDICRAHEAYWQAIADSLPGHPGFTFTQTMKDGADYCVALLIPPPGE